MDMKQDDREKRIQDQLKKDARMLEIPQSLEPDNILNSIEKSRENKRKKKYARFVTVPKFVLAAASIAIVFMVGNAINGTGGNSVENTKPVRQTSSPSKEAVAVTYDEVYTTIQEAVKRQQSNYFEKADDMLVNDAQLESGTSSSKDETNKEYAGTNVQVQGVDEGDIVKNDGEYLYCLSGNVISIIKPEGATMSTVSKVTIKGMVSEFYVQEGRLVVIYTKDNTEASNKLFSSKMAYCDQAGVAIYDISNPAKPDKLKEFTQDGYIVSSRISDGFLYVFTNRAVGSDLAKGKLESYVPMVDGTLVEACNITMPACANVSNYLVISSVDIANPGKLISTKAVLSGAFQFYVSTNSIYTVENTTVFPYAIMQDAVMYEDSSTTSSTTTSSTDTTKKDQSPEKSTSRILKYSYDKGKITFVSSVDMDGTVDDQFSLDEYKDYLRVVTTVDDYKNNYTTYNNLYVFDTTLKKVGEITNLAKEERIYSARFMGDTGYFVTFRQVDPLFSVDLSDPKNPKILGELKITGFSSYLHFYKDNLLLGIGQEVDPETNRTIGVKLSMFDISDPSNVKEVNKKILKDVNYGEFLDNHKAIMINTDKNIFGFAGYGDYQENYNGLKKYYMVYSYDEDKGFVEELKLDCSGEAEKAGYDYAVRGTYIDDTLYIFSLQPCYWYGGENESSVPASVVNAYSLETGKQICKLKLNQ